MKENFKSFCATKFEAFQYHRVIIYKHQLKHILFNELHTKFYYISAEGDRGGVIEVLATVGSIILMILTFPISIFICFKGKLNKNHG